MFLRQVKDEDLGTIKLIIQSVIDMQDTYSAISQSRFRNNQTENSYEIYKNDISLYTNEMNDEYKKIIIFETISRLFENNHISNYTKEMLTNIFCDDENIDQEYINEIYEAAIKINQYKQQVLTLILQ